MAVVLQDGRYERALLRPSVVEILTEEATASVVAIDIPIHPPDEGIRAADLAAKRFLGRGGSSVFMTPPRKVLHAASYADARALCADLGIGVSAQSFALAKKILEVDALVGGDDRIVEVHPEVSFRHLTGRRLPKKKSWAGFAERRDALAGMGIEIPSDLGDAGRAGADDVLDAAVAAWSAARVVRGEALRLPADAEAKSRRGEVPRRRHLVLRSIFGALYRARHPPGKRARIAYSSPLEQVCFTKSTVAHHVQQPRSMQKAE